MRIFNENKTTELKYEDLDFNIGYLDDDIIMTHVEKTEGIEEQGHYEIIAEYDNGGKDVKWVVDIEKVDPVEEHYEEENIQIFKLFKKKELLINKIEKIRVELYNSDYKAIKYSEGLYTDEEYVSIRQERERLREEINFLEKQIRDIELYQKDKEE